MIGPNGVGKSNICQAFGLIGALVRDGLTDYILSLGGTKCIFTNECKQERKQGKSSAIDLSCIGLVSAEDDNNEYQLKYKYSFQIMIEEELQVKQERFSLYAKETNGRFRSILTAKRDNEKVNIKLKNIEMLGPAAPFLKDRKTLTFNISTHSFVGFVDLLSSLSMFCFVAIEDLKTLKVINIDPHIAKKPSDILEPNIMLSDGRRLSGAIAGMIRQNDKGINEISTFLATILPRFKNLNRETSTEGQSRSFSITNVDNMKFPAQSLSDGTIKIIAVLVGMLENEGGTAIVEEPENYIHPWATNSLIEYIRMNFSHRNCILTTHSETLLNAVYPTELVICSNENGITKASRLKNNKQIEKVISHSGFGCGYHYLAGSLGGVPS